MRYVLCCLAMMGLVLCASVVLAERQDIVGGTGHSLGGFSGTYTDPETGDTVTTVIAPRKPDQQQPWPPVYVYPQVTPQWPPTPGPMPGPTPIPDPNRPVTPLPSTPGSQWQSPFQYHKGR